MNLASVGEKLVLKFLGGLSDYTTEMPPKFHTALTRVKDEGLLAEWFENTQSDLKQEFKPWFENQWMRYY